MNKISVIILTKNEEKNIERALKSVQFCDEIIVVNDESTDGTINKILDFKFKTLNKSKIILLKKELKENFAEQRNWAMTKAKNEWILFLDADEEISLQLKNEIVEMVTTNSKKAYSLRRRDYFWGNELKYGEIKEANKKGIIRLIKKGIGKWVGTVHEEFIPNTIGMVGRVKGYINHYPHQTISEFISDINIYSTIRAKELYKNKVHSNIIQILFYPFGKFIYTYFFKLGFLDGAAGFAYAFIMSFHSFLVRTKLFQIQNTNENRL
ncbi:hypothetical protein COY87_03045 [Candidatus Roizmanbacteria bacterium CG_4_10_14_0_8_um_filter_33_9]|uniref:Glycosyltransferase 2-like domain-containing protein n=1 Tax=Candidatus Roizmanbacteria bacterium CG_4_10_14_0_8_um_filter_33_9 TaxID=1974826 RepID=A0A2M7QI92_9BACT|nr:MAG: hypothetical protein COY87_03045 [Candidatus Roizmanbacteria bacterium CG_4_10_14_0_8_um_filter_33_9]